MECIHNEQPYCVSDELYHYGVKGMKWGVRRRINQVQVAKTARRSSQTSVAVNSSRDSYAQAKQAYKQAKKAERNSPEAKAERVAKAKRAAKVGAVVAGTALAAYGAYKVNEYVKSKNGQIAAARGAKEAQKMFESLSNSARDSVASGVAKKASVSVNATKTALDKARMASNDNFRTAARNVIDYKRSGESLKNLKDLDYYKLLGEYSRTFGR